MGLRIERKLPGLPMLDNQGKVPFYFGRITSASERVQWVRSTHPEHKLIFLIGDTYCYWCPVCRHTVWQAEATIRGRMTCPACEGRILALSEGDQVRLHFRYAPNAAWSAWWAEGWNVEVRNIR